MTFVYSFVCRARGRISQEDMGRIVTGAHAVTANAPAVLGGEDEQAEDRADLALAGEMDRHIEEAAVFLERLEIV